MKAILAFFIITLCSSFFIQKGTDKSLNYVPTEEVAVKIAEAIWLPIYGEKILKYKPYKATLKDKKVWIVTGTLSKGLGGTPYIEIQKSDCKILVVTHGK